MVLSLAPHSQHVPAPSALTTFVDSAAAQLPTNALPLEVLHNLRYQHSWTDLRIRLSPASSIDTTAIDNFNNADALGPLSRSAVPQALQAPPVSLLSGFPPRPIYTHPDFQAHLLAHGLTDTDIPAQREWVLPMKIGEQWTLKRFCAVFDALPTRTPLRGAGSHSHQDAKRVVLAMLSHQGKGGDGTIVYYIMQEGDVKPRQN
jgi:tRNA-splicing endonuclease subunit Sen15, fungi type